jgi:hypothetical protein
MRVIVLGVLCLVLALGVVVPSVTADEVDRWLHEATSTSPQIRLQALQALGRSGDIRALPPLLAALHDNDPTLRSCAIDALRSLARSLQGLYRTVAQWVEELLVTLGVTTPPEPPTEWVQHLQRI